MPDVKALIQRLGGPVAVGNAIERTHGAVCQWTKVPTDYVPQLVALSHEVGDPMTAKDMRPDIKWELIQ